MDPGRITNTDAEKVRTTLIQIGGYINLTKNRRLEMKDRFKPSMKRRHKSRFPKHIRRRFRSTIYVNLSINQLACSELHSPSCSTSTN